MFVHDFNVLSMRLLADSEKLLSRADEALRGPKYDGCLNVLGGSA